MDFRQRQPAADRAGGARQASPVAAQEASRRVQNGRNAAPAPLACPRLGLADDALTHALFPTPEHRCYADRTRRPGLTFQARFCLGGRYLDCDEFRRYERRTSGSGPSRTLARLRAKLPLGLRLLLRSVGLTVFFGAFWLGHVHLG